MIALLAKLFTSGASLPFVGYGIVAVIVAGVGFWGVESFRISDRDSTIATLHCQIDGPTKTPPCDMAGYIVQIGDLNTSLKNVQTGLTVCNASITGLKTAGDKATADANAQIKAAQGQITDLRKRAAAILAAPRPVIVPLPLVTPGSPASLLTQAQATDLTVCRASDDLIFGAGAVRPLAIDLFCGLGGWTTGLLAEGYEIIGFDIEQHVYGEHRYPAQLVIQDVLTLHGSQFKDAALIVASPPCQEYSYMAMPWKRAKAKAAAIRADETGQKLADLNRLFDACFRIQAEASIAAGRHIPMVVENVRGAIPWVGRSRWNFGSFHLWGDVPALMPHTLRVPPKRAMDDLKNGQRKLAHAHLPVGSGPLGRNAPGEGFKSSGMSGRSFQTESVKGSHDGLGGYGGNFGWDDTPMRRGNSKSPARKAASAMIAKIPEPLSRHIARSYLPRAA